MGRFSQFLKSFDPTPPPVYRPQPEGRTALIHLAAERDSEQQKDFVRFQRTWNGKDLTLLTLDVYRVGRGWRGCHTHTGTRRGLVWRSTVAGYWIDSRYVWWFPDRPEFDAVLEDGYAIALFDHSATCVARGVARRYPPAPFLLPAWFEEANPPGSPDPFDSPPWVRAAAGDKVAADALERILPERFGGLDAACQYHGPLRWAHVVSYSYRRVHGDLSEATHGDLSEAATRR